MAMGYLDNLTQARLQISERLVEITTSPKPSYNVNGQQVSWTEYSKALTEQLDKLNDAIAAGEVDGTPFEIISQGFTG